MFSTEWRPTLIKGTGAATREFLKDEHGGTIMNETLMREAAIISSDLATEIDVCSKFLQVLNSKREQLSCARKVAEANGYENTTLGLILGGLTNVYLSNNQRSELILQKEHVELIVNAMDEILKQVIEHHEEKLAQMVRDYKQSLL